MARCGLFCGRRAVAVGEQIDRGQARAAGRGKLRRWRSGRSHEVVGLEAEHPPAEPKLALRKGAASERDVRVTLQVTVAGLWRCNDSGHRSLRGQLEDENARYRETSVAACTFSSEEHGTKSQPPSRLR